ncbi:DUF6809 family protein [Gorillibacterium sp. sgz500922]|uniref:DUF6809 family protein n=1 Tax=Gorillibacterium sp. sgz500922 TaxID=3446694 RepID=UPI003F66DE1C
MTKLLEQLYYGELRPDEELLPENMEHRRVRRQIEAALEKWKEGRVEEEIMMLEDLLERLAERHGIEQAASFIQGFRLGAGIVAEALVGPRT